MMALLPPSSSSERPKRFATTSPTRRPMRVEPVADNEREAAVVGHELADRRAVADDEREDGRVHAVGAADLFRDLDASDGGERSLLEGFQSVASPQAAASAAVPGPDRHGKIESRDDCRRRRAAATAPSSGGRDAPTRWSGRAAGARGRVAKSQISIISCTSPPPSGKILPASSETSWPSSVFRPRRALPNWRTISPRFGAGTSRHARKASAPPRPPVRNPPGSPAAPGRAASRRLANASRAPPRAAPRAGEDAGVWSPFARARVWGRSPWRRPRRK